MVLPLIMAGVGVVSSLASLSSQNAQAKVQQASAQAQADDIQTQKELTQISIRNQQQLAKTQLLYDRMVTESQRTFGLIQTDVEKNQANIERISQRIALEQQQSQNRQVTAQRKGAALTENTNAQEQLQAAGGQLQQASAQQVAEADQTEAQSRGGGAAMDSSSPTALAKQALAQGDIAQALTLIQDKGQRESAQQLAYELGLLDIGAESDEAATKASLKQVDLAQQLDESSAKATADDIDAQTKRNLLGVEAAAKSEELALLQAQTSSDVTSASQARAVSNQAKTIQRPGFLQVASAVGNAALSAYQGYNAYQAGRVPTPPSTPASGYPVSGQEGFAASGLVPGLSAVGVISRTSGNPSTRTTQGGYPISGNQAYPSMGLIPR